jgi:hypothetical protein
MSAITRKRSRVRRCASIPAATAAGFRDLCAGGFCTGMQNPPLRREEEPV